MARLIKDVQIIDMADRGKAIGRTPQGEIVMVDKAVPGDVAHVMAYRKKKGIRQCGVEEYTELSSYRTTPFCAHFGVCGGCKWQHMSYEAQLQFKSKHVTDCIQRIAGKKDALILPIIPAPTNTHYRNKLEYSFSSKRWMTEEEISSGITYTDKTGLGFHPPGRFEKVVDLKECYLQPEPSNSIRNYLRSWTKEKEYSYYDALKHEGLMRNVLVRTSHHFDQCMVVVVFAKNDENRIQLLMEGLKDQFSQITSLYFAVNTKKNDSLWDVEMIHFSGNTFLEEKLGDTLFRIGPKSFFQTNTQQAEALYEVVKEFASLKGDETLYDLYCGIGSIGLFLAKSCGKVIGIEEVGDAIIDAKKNAELNLYTHTSFFSGDAGLITSSDFLEQNGKPDVMVTDPPRAGMHEKVVEGILACEPKKLVYVSCNPSTQARDIKLLSEKFDLIKVQAVDMFPHTSHVESVALLQMRNA